ncbi:exosortase-associated protein EpsI, V-type [Phenylobacterium kunshanense]|uniref:EpsI family protein n=1 Tax=Phenylobacterium kunshanense TaxID=1445034 RepID=A0A328BHD6_9CAUL|nr:exosortase-associated protein EpsI, V-type [Phenylobacterium kunshanense]RAK66533.1 EpsI family protein [Phenylobacterium kunshanense]
MRRRDLVLAGLAVGALGAAEALRPRRKMKLLKSGTVAQAIPEAFGLWEAHADELVSPEQAGRLARTLYSEIVGRTYVNAESGAGVMVLAAYGDTQSDLLQLHRPESCYPAVGFTLTSARSIALPLRPGVTLPAREVVATMEGRTENILYWTRMGETLPRTGGEQREARLQNAIQGVVPDGILLRCSMLGESEKSFSTLSAFVPELLRSVPKPQLPALIGTNLAKSIG